MAAARDAGRANGRMARAATSYATVTSLMKQYAAARVQPKISVSRRKRGKRPDPYPTRRGPAP